jgi:hypothetical protein
MKDSVLLEAEEPGPRKVARTCELLEVSKAAYYQSLKAEPSNPCPRRRRTGKGIAQVHRVSYRAHGSRPGAVRHRLAANPGRRFPERAVTGRATVQV